MQGRIFEAVIGDMDALELPPGAGAAASAASAPGAQKASRPAREEATLAEEEMGVLNERQPSLKVGRGEGRAGGRASAQL
eukprot:1146135-Pelagomonas_calceolata.AAC.15